jgi:RNA polymerase sigma-70 factor, ECF subfamily
MANQDDRQSAAVDLFREHGPAIYRFALLMARDRADAEDVVQETFLKLLTHLEAGGDRRNLRGWLFTVAAHGCRDRARGRLRWLPWTAANEPMVAPSPLRDEDGRVRAAREGLQQLPSRDRLLLTLRAQGLSYREIAVAARIRGSSVGRLLARAVDRWERAAVAAAPLPNRTGDRHEVSR